MYIQVYKYSEEIFEKCINGTQKLPDTARVIDFFQNKQNIFFLKYIFEHLYSKNLENSEKKDEFLDTNEFSKLNQKDQ